MSASSPLLPPKTTTTSLATTLLLFSAVTLLFIFLPNSSPARPSAIILISFDGFRFGYHHKTPTPNLHRLAANGTSADLGLIPVFPTLTFPNHYSIVTGLYPSSHGIVNNRFPDPDDPSLRFGPTSHEPHWWLGEPIWETAAANNLPAAVYFWGGGEVKKGSWTCPPEFCPKYNGSVPFEDRIDTVLSYFDLPPDEIPVFTAVYFSDPDSQGHLFGPDHPEITAAVAHLDRILGRLIEGLEKRGIFEEVNIIVVGDHGMVGICEEKYVFLEDLKPWVEVPGSWVESWGPLLAVHPPATVSAAELVGKMNEGLRSGKVDNGDKLRVYLKEELPERLHYNDSNRIAPVVGLVEEGYMVEVSRRQGSGCGGNHGYDNQLFSMRSIFVGHGPRFEKGRKIPSFQNVEIYNMMTDILGVTGAPNNGSHSFAQSVLVPKS